MLFEGPAGFFFRLICSCAYSLMKDISVLGLGASENWTRETTKAALLAPHALTRIAFTDETYGIAPDLHVWMVAGCSIDGVD
jgi:hypothetical protein